MEERLIYPITVIMDRYTGIYSGGEWTAWNCYPWDIPEEISGDDTECFGFWLNVDETKDVPLFGTGNTPEEAIADLRKKLIRRENHDTR